MIPSKIPKKRAKTDSVYSIDGAARSVCAIGAAAAVAIRIRQRFVLAIMRMEPTSRDARKRRPSCGSSTASLHRIESIDL